MAESNQAAELEAQLQALLKRNELDLLAVVESGLHQLRERLGGMYAPGLLMAEEYCQKMRERQP